jgi:MoxR-like ATPase
MQERRVTVQGRTYDLPAPFFVFATQNPIELEGTYPLPEAQLDRFMFSIHIGYSGEDDEIAIVKNTTGSSIPPIRPIITGPELLAYQALVRRVPAADDVVRYAVTLARMSRPTHPQAPEFVKKYLSYGASVRAAQFLVLGAKARALMAGRYHVHFDDIKALAGPVLRHRLLRNFHAESERVDADTLVAKLVEAVPLPRSGM